MKGFASAAAAFACLAATLVPSASEASSPAVRASCSQNGRILYREDFPDGASAQQRMLVAARHPGAMCVFLDASGRPGPSGSMADTPSGDGPVGQADDEGLAAALAVISSGETGRRYPDEFTEAMAAAAGSAAPSKASPPPAPSGDGGGHVNLTIGIYRDMPMEAVVAHWKVMREGTRHLARYAPTFSVLDGLTVVSVERVPDSVAAGLCEEAGERGSGCIAVY